MKVKNLACALLVAVCMMSCAAESTEMNEPAEVAFSLEKTFNARSMTYTVGSKNMPNLAQLPPVTLDEADKILHALRDHKNMAVEHSLQTTEGEEGQKFLTISTECCVAKQHKLTLQLSMITYDDDGSLYYKDCNGFASSQLYKWQLTGFGLASTTTAGLYTFECTSYLYFKIADKEIGYIQVPVKVNGTYNSTNHEVNFTYSL